MARRTGHSPAASSIGPFLRVFVLPYGVSSDPITGQAARRSSSGRSWTSSERTQTATSVGAREERGALLSSATATTRDRVPAKRGGAKSSAGPDEAFIRPVRGAPIIFRAMAVSPELLFVLVLHAPSTRTSRRTRRPWTTRRTVTRRGTMMHSCEFSMHSVTLRVGMPELSLR